MADEKEPPKEPEESRRFRLSRKVKSEPVLTREEKEMKALEEDDADRGTPAMDRELRKGCTGCLRVTTLFFVIMIASIIATCSIRQ